MLRELTDESYAGDFQAAGQDAARPAAAADEQAGLDRALENNLDVIAAPAWKPEVAEPRDVKLARSGHLPEVSGSACWTGFDSDTTQTNNGVTGPADSDQTGEDTVGVQVRVPIFSGGVTQSRVREQVYLQRAVRRTARRRALACGTRETRDAYLGVLAEKARVQALRQAVKSSQHWCSR